MSYAVYQHTLGPVRLSEKEAELVKTVEDARLFGRMVPSSVMRRYALLMDAVDRVASWPGRSPAQ